MLQDLEHLRVPRTIPGLVTQRVLIMTFLPGEQITHLQVQAALLSLSLKLWSAGYSALPAAGRTL